MLPNSEPYALDRDLPFLAELLLAEQYASGASIIAPGSGYHVGDTITLTGGIGSVSASLTVDSLSGSGVASVTLLGGIYSVFPTNPVSQGSVSPAGGSGATFDLTFGGTWLYSWVEASYNPNGSNTMSQDGRSGNAINSPATEINNQYLVLSSDSANPTYAWLRMSRAVGGEPWYEFDNPSSSISNETITINNSSITYNNDTITYNDSTITYDSNSTITYNNDSVNFSNSTINFSNDSLTFTSDTATVNSSSFTVNSSSVTLNSSSFTSTSGVYSYTGDSVALTNVTYTVNGNSTIQTTGANVLTFNGNIATCPASTFTVNGALVAASGGTVTIAAPTTVTATSITFPNSTTFGGAGSITVTPPTTFAAGSNPTFQAPTTFAAGSTPSFASPTTFGTSSNPTFAAPTTFSTTSISFPNSTTFGGAGSLTINDPTTFDAAATINNNFFLTQTASTITGTTNNWTPPTTPVAILTGASTPVLTGITPVSTSQDQVLWLTNTSSTAVTVSNQSASSSANNRIITSTGADLTLGQNQTVMLIYVPSLSRWVAQSGTAFTASGGSSSLTTTDGTNTDSGTETITFGSGLTYTKGVGGSAGNDTVAVTGGGSASPGGNNTDVQFNDMGAFGGSDSFQYNKATGQFYLTDGTTVIQLISTSPDIGVYLTDAAAGTIQLLGDSAYTADFAFSTYEVIICSQSTNTALSATDGTRIVYLCDGNVAVNAVAGNVKTLGTNGNTFFWNTGATAPTPQTVVLPTSVFGSGTITQLLGTPDAWVLVNVNGTNYKIPCYI